MKNRITNYMLLAGLLVASVASFGEDIDLFMGPDTQNSENAPNVLFIIDNTGNWTAPFEGEVAALQAVFNNIKTRIESPTDELAINIGMMMFAESGEPNNNVDGGYVRAAIRPMGDTTSDGKLYAQVYGELIEGFHERDDKGNAGAGGLAMAEAYHYFAGLAPYAGNNKIKTDFVGNDHVNSSTTCCVESHPVWALPGNALDTFTSTSYNSPIAPGSCGKNYIIWISNGATQDPTQSSNEAYALLRAAAGQDVNQINDLNPVGSEDNWADEWARFMERSPEGIVTYTIDVYPEANRKGRGWSQLLKSMAGALNRDNGRYYVVDGDPEDEGAAEELAEKLVAVITEITGKILAVNSVFASVALPAASNAQSTFLNQVFIGQFRPDKDALLRWPGNMKQYQIGFNDDGTNLSMRDARDRPVVHTETGFIVNCASSFWSTADTYWSGALDLELDYKQWCTEELAVSNSPDGPIVEKGGHGQQLRAASPATRSLYTCDATVADCTAMTSFNTANTAITFGLLNTAADERDNTISWARGEDVDNEDDDLLTVANMRASAHGDVVHSRPVALNYNTNDEPQIVVYYSANDGILRAINGNRPDDNDRVDPTGFAPGQEIWSFMPPEFYPHITTLKTNTAELKVPATATSAPDTGIFKPYGIDGPIIAFEGDVPGVGTDRKYLFAGMRRGGRALYAFDVTSITSPQILWKKGCPADLADDAGCTTGWTDIGQTWSNPNLLYANGYVTPDVDADLKPMVIVGGGYDTCEDDDNNTTDNNSCPADPKGNLIYILDAYDGSILKTLPTERGVAGGVTVVPYSDELTSGTMFAYAADLGGNIYRISGGTADAPEAIADTHPSLWVIKKIASLGCATAADDCAANRKFLFGPDVVRIPNYADQFAILVGSGDREKPLLDYGAANGIQNYFFTIFDHPTDPDWLDDDVTAGDGVCAADIICMDTLTGVTIDGVPEGETLSAKGWRLPLRTGEQVVTGAITAYNIANFSTHIPPQPDADVCAANLGTATAYSLNYKTGKGRRSAFIGGGLPPTPVVGKVLLEIPTRDDDGELIYNDDGELVVEVIEQPVCLTCSAPPDGTDDDGDDTTTGTIFDVGETGSGITWEQPTSRVYWNIQQ